ncbi:MAG: hypothetical protein HC785_32990 [Calothrix sp. CSU_2_0]|nr:hypothetical protein [Calothrix sp. CSU_2_0]
MLLLFESSVVYPCSVLYNLERTNRQPLIFSPCDTKESGSLLPRRGTKMVAKGIEINDYIFLLTAVGGSFDA